MQPFFLTVEQYGNKIYERFIDENGVEQSRQVEYKPTMFYHGLQGQDSKYRDIYGKTCVKKKFDSIDSARKWRKEMQDIGQEAMGMDDFKLAYLSDTYGSELVYDRRLIRVANADIEVTAPEFPDPLRAMWPVDAITHYDSLDDKFYVFDLLDNTQVKVSEWDRTKAIMKVEDGGDGLPEHLVDRVVYMAFNTEVELLSNYIMLWQEKPPVIFTGWNVEGFDIPYLCNRIKNVLGENALKRMSPMGRVTSKVIQNIYGDKEIYSIWGVSILDYLDLYKKFSFTNLASYALDYAAKHELGEKNGKIEYEGPINKFREANHQLYISYNIVDVLRVQQIDERRQFIELALSLAYYARMQIQSCFSPLKTWDAIIFNSLKEQDKVIPESKHHHVEGYPGAFVKQPVPGAYRWVLSADLTSLYPSIIRQVNISPETLVAPFMAAPIEDYINRVAAKPSEEYSCSPNGWMFRKDIDGVIPVEIAKVFFQRKAQKGVMLTCDRNKERVKGSSERGGERDIDWIDVRKDFDDDTISKLHTLHEDAILALIEKCERASMAADTAQHNRKILINSLYGALGNVYFRYYDLRNASAITLFGQLALQWIERKVNEYLNGVCKTEGVSYVFYGDTDSIYMCVDNLIERVGGEARFTDTNHLVDFLDKFAKEKLEPAIDAGFRELCEYMNNKEHLMFMDREVIAGPPLGSKGLGGFWTAKKRYALNVWDNEGTRYAEPKLKIMGLETQRSSTPKAVQKALKECIRRILQEGEESLQVYYKEFEEEFRRLPYQSVAAVSSANNLMKYSDSAGYPTKGTPKHVKGALAFNRMAKDLGVEPLREGDKVMMLPLRPMNPFKEESISWSSGTKLPPGMEKPVLDYLDYPALFAKTFVKPLSSITEACAIQHEKKASLLDLFDI